MARTKVQSELIATNAISGTIIADGAITSTHLAANCVDSSELVTGSIDTIHIAANQVTATKIVTNAIQTRHIADDQVTEDKLANAINTSIAAKLPLAGGTMTGNLIIDPSAAGAAVLGLERIGAANQWKIAQGHTATDYLEILEGSTARLTIKNGGNVGIGTTSPSHALHISGANNDAARVRVHNSASGQASLDLDNSEGYFRTFTDAGEYRIYDQTDGAYRLLINTSGNVGMGPSSPLSKLHISGNSDVSDEACMLTIDDEDTSSGSMIPAIQFRGNGSNLARIRANDQQGLLLSGSSGQGDDIVVQAGKVGMGTNSPAVSKGLHINSAGNSELRLTTTQDSGTPTAQIGYGAGSGYFFRLGDAANNEDIMFRTYGDSYIANNLGLGTSSPSSPLHVTSTTANTNGMVRFQNNMDNNYETLRIESLGDYDAHIGFLADGSSNYYWGAGVDYSDSGSFKIANDNLLATNTKLTINTTGQILANGGGVTVPTFSFIGDTNTGMTRPTGDTLQFVTGGVERLRLGNGQMLVNDAAIDFNAGKSIVYGGGSTGTNGGTVHYNGVGREYRNVVSTHTAASSARYWHIKTNFQSTNNIMFVARVHGYSYGNSGHIVDIQRSGYAYAAHGQLTGSQTVNNGSSSDALDVYFSSDNYVCFRHTTPSSGYYNGYSFDIKMQSPTGYNWNFSVQSHAINDTSGEHF